MRAGESPYTQFHQALESLYGETLVRLASDKTDRFDHSKFDKAAEHIHRHQGFEPEMLADEPVVALMSETNRVLQEAVSSAITQEVPPELTAKLERDTFIFSGFKTYHELKEASELLKDDRGGFKSFETFRRDIEQIDNRYNRNYLNAEYNYAVQSTQMAVRWQEFERDGAHYDLQYRTAGDEKVREEHAALNRITLPVNDKFWDEYLPPLGWNCRCTAVQVLKGKYPESDSAAAIAAGEQATAEPKQRIFRFNPGKQGKVFPPKHPYKKAPKKVKEVIEQTPPNDKLKDTVEALKQQKNIAYLKPEKLDKTTSEEQIITRLAGSDQTSGSCSSLAFAYAGNKSGIDILDFRDGESRRYFARNTNIKQIVNAAGGKVVEAYNDFDGARQVLSTIEVGKEYYFACARHAAIVRKTDNGLEYLELQSELKKGWHRLTSDELRWRFGAKKSHSFYGSKYKDDTMLVEVGQLGECGYFEEMLGYINTQADKQHKGKGGSIK